MAIELFTLVRERCLLDNLNIRTEMHGDEREAACDLKFKFSSANNLLSKLHPDLRAAFYRANETRDLVNPDHMPHLRFPMLGQQSYDLEIPRTRLRVHDAEDATHDVILGGGKTNKFKLTLKEGGTVEWEFRCQFSKPDEDAIAKLMRVLNQVVPITLECADEEEKPDNFKQVEQLSLTGTAPSEARQKAESMFDKPGTDMKLADTEQVETAPVTLDPPGKPKRVTKAESAPAATDETAPPKAKRASRKAAEVE
ncbi:MAG: hypothetical protein V4641_31475 [Pseudomonadota bacterium]